MTRKKDRRAKPIKGFMLRHLPLMLTCKEFDAFILDYAEGNLPASQQLRFKIHLRLCRECRQFVTAYLSTVKLSRASFATEHDGLPNEAPEKLVRAIIDLKRD